MNRSRPPLFVELCAGTAALSLRLAAPRAKPPVSRMGAKTGYAKAILQVLGLRAGIGADHYLWCEPDNGCRMMLYSYRDPDLRAAAAEKIRSWKDEDPKELWLRLRAMGPIVAPDPDEVARWCLNEGWTNGGRYMGPDRPSRCHGPNWTASITLDGMRNRLDNTPTMQATIAADARCVDPDEVARWIRITTANRLINLGPDWKNTGIGGSTFGGDEFCTPIDTLVSSLDSTPTVDAVVVGDARCVDPGEVARWCCLAGLQQAGANIKYENGKWLKHTGSGWGAVSCRYRQDGTKHPADSFTIGSIPARLDDTPTIPATITADACHVEPIRLPPGTIVYIDGPYQNTTGYQHDLDRAAQVELARRWHAAGAIVVMSEAEPITELEGWYTVDITNCRIGQKRTFSKQKQEWLTMSHPPAWRPPVQRSLFAMAPA